MLQVNYRAMGPLARVKGVKIPCANCAKDGKRSKLYTSFNPVPNMFLTCLACFWEDCLNFDLYFFDNDEESACNDDSNDEA
jgi:hypothetical protein